MSTEKPSEESSLPTRLTFNVNQQVRYRTAMTNRVDIQCQSGSRCKEWFGCTTVTARDISMKLYSVANLMTTYTRSCAIG
jgi:hypothetical protein